MQISLWEVGVLLIGIGILIVCINLASTIKAANVTIQKVDDLIDDNYNDIVGIVSSVAGISGTANSLVGSTSKVMNIIGGVKAAKSFSKKRNTRRD